MSEKKQYVTDPALLEQLNAPSKEYVTDPALLSQLNDGNIDYPSINAQLSKEDILRQRLKNKSWLPRNLEGFMTAPSNLWEGAKQTAFEIKNPAQYKTPSGETATAQQIKGQYATLRLKTYQDEVARFASQILRIKAQIICQHFQPETIIKIGGAELLSQTDQQLVPQAIQLLQDSPMRTFRIEIATDSMLYADEAREG